MSSIAEVKVDLSELSPESEVILDQSWSRIVWFPFSHSQQARALLEIHSSPYTTSSSAQHSCAPIIQLIVEKVESLRRGRCRGLLSLTWSLTLTKSTQRHRCRRPQLRSHRWSESKYTCVVRRDRVLLERCFVLTYLSYYTVENGEDYGIAETETASSQKRLCCICSPLTGKLMLLAFCTSTYDSSV